MRQHIEPDPPRLRIGETLSAFDVLDLVELGKQEARRVITASPPEWTDADAARLLHVLREAGVAEPDMPLALNVVVAAAIRTMSLRVRVKL